MPLDVEIGRYKEDLYVVRYLPPTKRPVVLEKRPLLFCDLTEDKLIIILKGLKKLYGQPNLIPLTKEQGIGEELTPQEIEDISDKLQMD